jgi:hypothetical protein
MKNELYGKANNNMIDEAIFLGNKKYAYKYTDLNNNIITKVYLLVLKEILSHELILNY